MLLSLRYSSLVFPDWMCLGPEFGPFLGAALPDNSDDVKLSELFLFFFRPWRHHGPRPLELPIFGVVKLSFNNFF